MHIMTTHQTARIHQIGLPVLIGASPLWAFGPFTPFTAGAGEGRGMEGDSGYAPLLVRRLRL